MTGVLQQRPHVGLAVPEGLEGGRRQTLPRRHPGRGDSEEDEGRARAEGKRVGRPPALTEETLTAVRQDLAEGMPVAAVARKYDVPRTTLIGHLERSARNG